MAHPLVLLKCQKGIAALYPSRVVISFTNTAKRHDTASLMKLSVLASLGGIDAACPMAHSSHCVHPGTAPQAQSHKTIILWMGLQRGGGQRKNGDRCYQQPPLLFTVSKMRVELTRPIGHYPLKVARLPIPPPGQKESERRDSDPRPRPWQGRALPTELLSQSKYCYQYRTIVKFKERERKTGLGPATPTLARSCSTN